MTPRSLTPLSGGIVTGTVSPWPAHLGCRRPDSACRCILPVATPVRPGDLTGGPIGGEGRFPPRRSLRLGSASLKRRLEILDLSRC